MLQDYRVYLTNIRNNLIQCGVDYPINSMETYEELFTAGMELDEVLWYYSILAVSGSKDALKNYFLPLNGYYKEKMRQVFYKEFMDFIKDYRRLSTTYTLLGNTDDISVLLDKNSVEFEDDEEIDLFEDEELGIKEDIKIEEKEEIEEYEEPIKEEIIKPIGLSSNDFLNIVRESKEEYVPHGIFIDEDNELEEEYCEHGIYLDELEDDEMPEVLDEEYCEHGVYLDDLPDEEESENDVQYDENGFEIEEGEHIIDDNEDFGDDYDGVNRYA